jgi:hypothetical protein
VLILNFGSTSAQQYQLFPDSNATWLVQEHSSEYTLYHNWFLSEQANDTVISGKKYTKVFEKPYGTDYVSYSGAFRNDHSGKSYFISPFGQEEFILQDFTKKAGDTVFDVAVHYYDFLGAYDFLVDSVVFYPCGPYTLKFIALHSIEFIPLMYGTYLNWIEKIGSTSGGIFNQPAMGLNVYNLKCYNSTDTIFYKSNILWLPESLVYYHGNCNEFLAVDKPIRDELFSIYPNPFADQLYIRSNQNIENLRLDVYDLMGRLMHCEMVPNYLNTYTTRTFSNLKPGNYFLLITTKHKQPWKQIITKM